MNLFKRLGFQQSLDPRGIGCLCVLNIACVVLITYFHALQAGLLEDNWMVIEQLGRLSWSDYLLKWSDPRFVPLEFRPLPNALFALGEHTLFDTNIVGYHLTSILVHLSSCLLLFAIVWQYSKKVRLAFISALIFAGLPAFSWAVIWPLIAEPWAVFFYLWAVWLWILYLQSQRPVFRILTHVMFIFLLLSRENGITLPAVLALIDLLLFKTRFDLKALLHRYTVFALIAIPYLIVEWSVQSRGWYASSGLGYSLGTNVISNLTKAFGILAFPWLTDTVWNLLATVIILLISICFTIKNRSRIPLFLFLSALVTISPLLPFASTYFQPRFLYLSTTCPTVAFALLFERALTDPLKRKRPQSIALASLFVILFANGLGVADSTTAFAERSRQEGVPIRDIFRQHPTFPKDTYLYFIVPHGFLMGSKWTGRLFLRYGNAVCVKSTNDEEPARLRDHNVMYIYYFDETGRPIEISVDKNAGFKSSLPLPVRFAEPLYLEGYEVASAQVKRGGILGVLLYWRAGERIAKDYTVFAHLVDARGQLVAGYDSQPKQGTAPTSTWHPNQFFADSIIMPIPSDVPVGSKYRLELGIYYLPTMERLEIVDASGQMIADTVTIESFSVVE